MISVGFTGTRHGTTPVQQVRLDQVLVKFRDIHSKVVFHHGDCTGADEEAHYIGRSLGFYIVSHPPTNSKYRAFTTPDETRPPADYLLRNQDIVRESHVLVAVPSGMTEELRSGTWSTVRYARLIDRAIILVYPDGAVVEEVH